MLSDVYVVYVQELLSVVHAKELVLVKTVICGLFEFKMLCVFTGCHDTQDFNSDLWVDDMQVGRVDMYTAKFFEIVNLDMLKK